MHPCSYVNENFALCWKGADNWTVNMGLQTNLRDLKALCLKLVIDCDTKIDKDS